MKRITLTAIALMALPAMAAAQDSTSSATGSSVPPMRYSTRELQTALAQAGYYTGPRNGRMTAATRAAVRKAKADLQAPDANNTRVFALLNGDAVPSGSAGIKPTSRPLS